MEYGLYESKIGLEEKEHHGKVIRLGEHIVLDRERCVLCFR
jgi:NADH dehydrogenase/NADH:ubiquinone oxidoreductase subunit G